MVVSRTRPSAGLLDEAGGVRPGERLVERWLEEGQQRDPGLESESEDDGLGRSGGRVEARFHAARRQGGGDAVVGRPERPDIAVEAGGVPAPVEAVEGMGARPDGFDRTALPVGEVVPALMPGPGPVRQLVSTEAGLGQAMRRRGGTSRRPGRRPGPSAPARASVAPRRSSAGDRRPARSALGVRVVEDQGIQRQVVRAEAERALEAVGPGRQRSDPGRRTAGRG